MEPEIVNGVITEPKPNILLNGKMYYDITGAAPRARLSDRTLRREINRKHIRCLFHPSLGFLFLQEWIDEYLESKIIVPRKHIR